MNWRKLGKHLVDYSLSYLYSGVAIGIVIGGGSIAVAALFGLYGGSGLAGAAADRGWDRFSRRHPLGSARIAASWAGRLWSRRVVLAGFSVVGLGLLAFGAYLAPVLIPVGVVIAAPALIGQGVRNHRLAHGRMPQPGWGTVIRAPRPQREKSNLEQHFERVQLNVRRSPSPLLGKNLAPRAQSVDRGLGD